MGENGGGGNMGWEKVKKGDSLYLQNCIMESNNNNKILKITQ